MENFYNSLTIFTIIIMFNTTIIFYNHLDVYTFHSESKKPVTHFTKRNVGIRL